MKGAARTGGFSIVEVLVAVAILGFVVSAVVVPMTTFFAVNRNASRTLDLTTTAQRVLDQAQGAMITSYSAPNTAINSLGTLPGGVSITCQNIDVFGRVMAGTCASNPAPPARRLTVTGSLSAQPPVVLTLDVRP